MTASDRTLDDGEAPDYRSWVFVRLAEPRRFRHYRDRRPPWVKLPESLARDPRFRALSDAAKSHALHLILRLSLPTTLGPPGMVLEHPEIVAHYAGTSDPVDVDSLVRAGVLERCYRDGTVPAPADPNGPDPERPAT